MTNSLTLREQRASINADARKIYDRAKSENRGMTSEENATFDKMMSDVDAMKIEIDQLEKREKLDLIDAEMKVVQERKANKPTPCYGKISQRESDEALRAWCLAGTDHARSDGETLFRASECGIKLNSKTLNVRALSKGTNTAGGYLVPTDLASQIEIKLKYYCPIRNFVNVLTTETGNSLDFSRADDTSNGARIVGEAGTINTNVDPSFDKITLSAWKWATDTVRVSVELLQDAIIDLPAYLGEEFGNRMGRSQSTSFTNGTGSSQPQGLVTGAATGISLATGNAITYAKMIDFVHSLNIIHRPNATMMFHDSFLAALRKIVDSNGQPLFQPGLVAGAPDRVLGIPFVVNNDMTDYGSSPGDDATLAIYGDMKKYTIRDVAPSLVVTRLDELYAATGEVGFVMLQRTDGRYLGHSGCVVKLNSFDAP